MSLKRLRKASSTVSVGIGSNVSKSSRSIHSSALGRERLAKSTMASRTATIFAKYLLWSLSCCTPVPDGFAAESSMDPLIISIVAQESIESQSGWAEVLERDPAVLFSARFKCPVRGAVCAMTASTGWLDPVAQLGLKAAYAPRCVRSALASDSRQSGQRFSTEQAVRARCRGGGRISRSSLTSRRPLHHLRCQPLCAALHASRPSPAYEGRSERTMRPGPRRFPEIIGEPPEQVTWTCPVAGAAPNVQEDS